MAKVLTEQEIALRDLIEAKEEVQRAEIAFNEAEEEYFEIANAELTVAYLKWDLCVKKMKKACSRSDVNPKLPIFHLIANPKSYI